MAVAAAALSACTSVTALTLDDDRLAQRTAIELGTTAENVLITSRHSDLNTTTYIAEVVSTGALHTCTTNGGGPLAYGMINEVRCRALITE